MNEEERKESALGVSPGSAVLIGESYRARQANTCKGLRFSIGGEPWYWCPGDNERAGWQPDVHAGLVEDWRDCPGCARMAEAREGSTPIPVSEECVSLRQNLGRRLSVMHDLRSRMEDLKLALGFARGANDPPAWEREVPAGMRKRLQDLGCDVRYPNPQRLRDTASALLLVASWLDQPEEARAEYQSMGSEHAEPETEKSGGKP